VDQGEPPSPSCSARVEAVEVALSPRASVEREFGRLKNEWALLPLRVHAIEPVLLQADLAILANLACALGRACAIPLAP